MCLDFDPIPIPISISISGSARPVGVSVPAVDSVSAAVRACCANEYALLTCSPAGRPAVRFLLPIRSAAFGLSGGLRAVWLSVRPCALPRRPSCWPACAASRSGRRDERFAGGVPIALTANQSAGAESVCPSVRCAFRRRRRRWRWRWQYTNARVSLARVRLNNININRDKANTRAAVIVIR